MPASFLTSHFSLLTSGSDAPTPLENATRQSTPNGGGAPWPIRQPANWPRGQRSPRPSLGERLDLFRLQPAPDELPQAGVVEREPALPLARILGEHVLEAPEGAATADRQLQEALQAPV